MKKRLINLIILFVVILTSLPNCLEIKILIVADVPPVIFFPPVKGPLNIPGKTLKPASIFQSQLLFIV